MDVGLVGLGRMGSNMARRLARAGIGVIAFDRGEAARAAVAAEPRVRVETRLAGVLEALPGPRAVWLMLPAGEATGQTIERLAADLSPGDLVVDGGNAYYKDSVARGRMLGERGIEFVDAGVSGGVWGLANGYCLMVGGTSGAVARVRPLLEALAPAPDRGWLHCGACGAGHFAKMVHNGIEYGMMQALAEGLSLLHARADLALDPAAVADLWRHGSVVRSWLLDLTARALREDGALDGVRPVVADSGEGRWTALEAVELGVPAPVMTLALMNRFGTQGRGDYAAKLLALMRAGFGGHAVQRKDVESGA